MTPSKTICPGVSGGIIIYAMGGGYGHLTRAIALARAIGNAGRVRILTNSPHFSRVAAAMPEIDIVNADRTSVVTEIQTAAPSCLIVDTFPRGLGGELVDLLSEFRGYKVLVARDLTPRYIEAYDLRSFIDRSYDLVLDAEATPWLVRSAHEILSREAARAFLGLYRDIPCVLVCPAGNADERSWYAEVAGAIPNREVRLLAHWPAMELYAAADVVVGGAGYNTVSECEACNVPLVARPWKRKYDRQDLRAKKASRVVHHSAEAVAAALELSSLRSSESRVIDYPNGAMQAAAQLLHLSCTSHIQRM